MIKIAIQKSGRLNEESLKLFKSCGIKIPNANKKLKTASSNFPLEILNLRNSDIPKYVADGVADLGILGENTLIEKNLPLKILKQLSFGKCKLSLAVPKEIEYDGIQFFNGKQIATSYPNTLKKFLAEKNLKADIHEINGSVEIAPSIGLAEGVCDLVESGNTLFLNGLKEVETILESQAVLVSNGNLSKENEEIVEKLLFRIDSHLRAINTKYVVLNSPNHKIEAICKLLPGIKSPSVMPLDKTGWSAIQTVISEDDFWNVIDKVKAEGAEGILVMPIEKMIY